MRYLHTTLIITVLGFTSLLAREFTSIDGRKLNGKIMAVSGDNVILEVGTKKFTVSIARFTEADIRFINQWAKNEEKNKVPNLEVRVNTGKRNRSDTNDDYDDRAGSVEFKLQVTNRESNFDVNNAKVKLCVVGEYCGKKDNFVVLQQKSFDLSVKYPETATLVSNKYSYTFDDRKPVRWGYDYYGYALQILNASGRVIYSKGIPAKFDDNVAIMTAYKVGHNFDRDILPASETKHKKKAKKKKK